VEALASMLEPTGQLVHSLSPPGYDYDYVIAPFAKNVRCDSHPLFFDDFQFGTDC
jgi:hypothetical protein